MQPDRIKIVLADANQIIREGTRTLLAPVTDIEICGDACSIKETIPLVRELQPDILIAGLNMSPFTDHTLIRTIKEVNRKTHLIILTNKTDSILVRKMLRSGIRGYLLKTCTPCELKSAIYTVANDGFYIHEQLKDIFMERLMQPAQAFPDQDVCISRREKEILNLIASEFINHEIAEQLHISIHTVETHRKKLLQKTGARNTAGLVRYAVENGIV